MTTLKIAIQKGGRLSEKSKELIKKLGIRVKNGGKLRAEADNFPLELLYLRDDDIPKYVARGVADLGIVGQNVIVEKTHEVQEIRPLGFGKCRLCLAVEKDLDYPGLEWFEGRRVATSYPKILQEYFATNKIKVSIEEISGSVEIAPSIGLTDAVFDIVSTGSTLIMNGLKEVETVMRSEAVLVGRQDLSPEKQALVAKLVFRLDSLLRSRRYKYILLNAPQASLDRVLQLLPGMKSPTVMPLADESWYSVHSVIHEEKFWEIIDQLKDCGAEGILICPIENMVL